MYPKVGLFDGCLDGCSERSKVGADVACSEGDVEGPGVGLIDGECVGFGFPLEATCFGCTKMSNTQNANNAFPEATILVPSTSLFRMNNRVTTEKSRRFDKIRYKNGALVHTIMWLVESHTYVYTMIDKTFQPRQAM